MQQGPLVLAAANQSCNAVRLAVKRSSRWLQRRPLLAKASSCAFGFAFGDVLTQYFNRRSSTYTHDVRKTAAMGIVGGAVAAPVGLALYRCMDAVWMPAPGVLGVLAAATKFTLDQVIGCIIWQAAYLSISPMYREMACRLLDTHAISIPVLRPLPCSPP